MRKRVIPYRTAKNVYEIDADFYRKENIKTIFIDLDNTLDCVKVPTPHQESIDVVNRLKDEFHVIIVSNNHKNRVRQYCEAIDPNLEFVFHSGKPLAGRMRKYIRVHGIDKESTILIGDQIYTDIIFCNKLGIKSVLTEPLTTVDRWVTWVNRHRDQRMRKKLKAANKYIDWRS
ncbi:MAG: HAD-IIIA family hydrolase [Coprobacillus sp.]|nr:HAD-IIIA family hydrolase [Coprobacillus sp.]